MVTLAQLEEIGLSGRAVRHRVATGRLRRLHRGIYAVGSVTAEGRWMAAVLAGGPGAVLSHRSAAALWGLCSDAPAVVHVTVRRRTTRIRPAVEIHSGESVVADDLTTRRGIPCTTQPRTLLDLAATVDRRSLARAIDRAEELRNFDLRDLERLLERNRGRRGARTLRAVLDAYEGPTVTRSVIEERFLDHVNAAGLPTPAVNAWISLPEGGGYRPDFLWRAPRLIVEIDGRAYHARRAAFRHDRRRDRRLALAGYETRRYAASELIETPLDVVAEVKAFLAHERTAP